MSRDLITLRSESDRAVALRKLMIAPFGTRIQFLDKKRSVEQNSRLWEILACISEQLDWHGQKYTPEEWKDFGMHAFRGEKWMPAEEGGMIPIGRATSKLSKDEFGDFMALLEAFCARHNVELPWNNDPSGHLHPTEAKAAE